MASFGLRRGNISIHGINGEQFAPRWDRLLLPFEGMPDFHFRPFHLGPAATVNPAPTADGHPAPTVPAPIDVDTPVPGDQDSSGLGSAVNAPDAAPAPQIEDAASALDDQALFWHPPYFAPNPISEAPIDPVSVPGDAAPPEGHLPKSEAVIWSGPAIMAFPPDAHETSGDAAAPEGAGDSVTAEVPGTSDVAGTSDVPDAPDVADLPDLLTRADLVPVLAAMGSGADHASDAGGGDLSAAFLPPDSGDLADLPHGLDLGFAFTPPPLPPPPDMI